MVSKPSWNQASMFTQTMKRTSNGASARQPDRV
jgi:hypothetical protein